MLSSCLLNLGVTIVLEPTNLPIHENESDAVIKVHKLGLSDLTTSVVVTTKDLSTTGMC